MQELINAHIFHPAYKDVKARCELTFCDNSENCPLLKKGKCVQNIGIIEGIKCPHGQNRIEYGYTKRAGHFYQWMKEKQKQYEPVLEKIDCAYTYKRLVDLGDYVYLPYPYLRNYVNSIPFIIGGHFCKKEDFTPKNIMTIIEFRPEALFGGIITSFTEKEPSRFIEHLISEIPEKYFELITEYPEIKEKYSKEKMNFINRNAVISTVRIGSKFKDHNGNEFIWDGECFICENWSSCFIPFRCKTAFMRTKPEKNEIIEITSNDQVDENTKFVD